MIARPDTTERTSRPANSGMPPEVLAFLEQLRRLPMGAWAEATRSAEMAMLPDAEGPDRRAIGRARLRHIVDGSPALTSRIRARVHDIVAVLDGFLHPVDVLRMKKAALGAALALAARNTLDPEDFHRLYAPFAELIPLPDQSLVAAGDGDDGARFHLRHGSA